MRRIIILNVIQCKNCGDVSLDGGHDYLRRCSETPDGYIDLSETAAPEEETNRGK